MHALKICGIQISSADMDQIHGEISRMIKKGGQGFIVSGNVHGLNLAKKYGWLADFYNKANVVRIDGAGVAAGARLLGHHVPNRLTWADWALPLAKYLAEKKHTVFFLGGPKKIAEQAADKLKKHAPGLKIAGTHHGYFSKTGPQNTRVVNIINKAAPDILVVGMGMPLQEKWIIENSADINAQVFITAGAAFEYIAGTIIRCPKWMGDAGLEWLFRLAQNPRRMARRYIIGNPLFFLRVLIQLSGLRRKNKTN